MSDLDWILDEIERRHEPAKLPPPIPAYPITEEELTAFIESPVWKVLQAEIQYHYDISQATRDDIGVSRDLERVQLGFQKCASYILNWPQKTLDNHKQTQSEENRHE